MYFQVKSDTGYEVSSRMYGELMSNVPNLLNPTIKSIVATELPESDSSLKLFQK